MEQASGNSIDCSDPLANSACAGYASAYLSAQCDVDQLYSESCPYYWPAYDDQQCDQDPQYAPFCQGYATQDSVAYYDDDMDEYGYDDHNGYSEEDMWYDEEYR